MFKLLPSSFGDEALANDDIYSRHINFCSAAFMKSFALAILIPKVGKFTMKKVRAKCMTLT